MSRRLAHVALVLAVPLLGCGSSVDSGVFTSATGSTGAGGTGPTTSNATSGPSGTSNVTAVGTSGVGGGSTSVATSASVGPSTTSGTTDATGVGGSSTSVGVNVGGSGGVAVTVTSASSVFPCHDDCLVGTPLDPSCDPCAAIICQEDPGCCTTIWDNKCVMLAGQQCGCVNATVATVSTGTGGCVTCGEAIQGVPGPICPQSEMLVQALGQCACFDQCSMQCFTACNGGQPDQGCQDCIVSACSAQIQACLNDI